MPSGVATFGKAVIGTEGKPTRIGLNVDGLDMVDTIQRIKEATLEGVKKQTDAIEKNKAVVIPALSELQAQFQTLRDDALALSNYPGPLASIPNAFQDLQHTISKSGEVTQTDYVSVTLNSRIAKATNPPLAIRITQLARSDSRISTTASVLDSTLTAIATADSALNLAGTFTINGGSVVTLIATDSLNAAITKINNSNSNVNARYIQNGSDFKLILEGTTLATPLTFTDTSGFLVNNFGIDVTAIAAANLQAIVEYDVKNGTGTETQTFNYNSNVVTNLSAGVTLNLTNTTKNSAATFDTLTISFGNNIDASYTQIVDFFKHYNDIKEVLNRNMLFNPDGGPLDPKATMFNVPIIRRLNQQLEEIAHMALQGAGVDDYDNWAEIGLMIDQTATGFQNNIFSLDSAKLRTALTTNFEKVKKLFGNYPVVSDNNFRVYKLGDNLSNTVAGEAITITYSNTGGTFYARFQCGAEDTGAIAQIDANELIGPEGSVFADIFITYGGAAIADGGSKAFTLTATQGIADRITKSLEKTLDKTSGQFVGELERIQEKNKTYQDKINRAEKQAEQVEKKMLAQAARLDAERSKYSKFSQMLASMFNNNNNN